MKFHHKKHAKWASLLLCMLALTLFLVACSTSGGSPTTSAPTPTPTSTQTASTCTTTGYTVTTPTGWKCQSESASVGGIVLYTNTADQTTTISISTIPAIGGIDVNQELTIALKAFSANYQTDSNVPTTTTVGGDTWQQVGASSNNLEAVVLADQHPATTGNIFAITLTTEASAYSTTNTTVFQPFLSTFKFS